MKRTLLSTDCSRRQFLSNCATCAGCVAGGALIGPRVGRTRESSGGKPKIRVVFCETTNDKPIWPNIGYDFEARRKQIADILTQKCPEVEFLVGRMMEDPDDIAADWLADNGF